MTERSANKELAEVIRQVVSYYKARCWWVDEDDLRQEAWTSAVKAKRSWDPGEGLLAPYAATIVRRDVAAYVLRASAPVSASWHQRTDLIGLLRADLEATAHQSPKAQWAEELLSKERWRVRVIARLIEVVGEDGAEGLEDLLREGKGPIGRPSLRRTVSGQIARTRIANDPELKAIWDERQEHDDDE